MQEVLNLILKEIKMQNEKFDKEMKKIDKE